MNSKIIYVLFFALILAACGQQKPSESTAQESASVTKAEPVEVVFHVEGMTCDHCEESIQKGVNTLEGISLVEANHEDSTTKVVFDPSATDLQEIAAAIEKRGYKVRPNND